MEEKVCTRCNISQPLDQFLPRSDNPQKLRSQCRECSKRQQREWRNQESVQEHERQYRKQYAVKNQDAVKAASKKWEREHRKERNQYQRELMARLRQDPEYVEQEKTRRSARAKQEREQHPERVKERSRKARIRNRNKIRAKSSEYEQRPEVKARRRERQKSSAYLETRRLIRQRHRSRKLNASGDITKTVWFEICQEHSWECYLCGITLDLSTAQIEHRIPLSRGGTNERYNIAPACDRCNARKGIRTEKEYRELLRQGLLASLPPRPARQPLRGERHGQAVLSSEQVKGIRASFRVGIDAAKDFALHYGVSERCIRAILKGDSWNTPDSMPDGWTPIERLPKDFTHRRKRRST